MLVTVHSLYAKMVGWLSLLGHRAGIALCLLYPTIVPAGIAEPWKYRKLMAVTWYIRFKANRAQKKTGSATEGVRTVRRLAREISTPLPPDPLVNVKVTTFDGVKVRLHEPNNRGVELLPGFIYFHGGGLAFGSSESYESITRDLCSRLNAVVISVDYRLAPENTFPAAYDDSLKASKWFLKNGGRYGVDLNRVAMGGDSAGGYLTALTTQALRQERQLPKIKVQLLIYPNIQIFDICTPSYQKCYKILGERNGVLPNILVPDFMSLYTMGKRDSNFIEVALKNLHVSAEFKKSDLYQKQLNVTRLIHEQYRESSYFDGPVNEGKGDDKVWDQVKGFLTDRRFSPLLEQDFSDLPPALVQTCEFDNLRDDGIIYAQRLQQAGVKVKSVNYEDGFHGIFSYQGPDGFKTGDRMMADLVNFAEEHL